MDTSQMSAMSAKPLPPMQAAADSFDLQKEAGPMAAPTEWKPSDNAMASNQLSKLLASDSKLMTLARSRAQEQANARGLLNSSMAAEAGEVAAIQSAVPIAQQDAQTWGQSEQFNAGAKNNFAQDANRFGREGALTKFQGQMARDQQLRDQAFQSGERQATQSWQAGQSVLDREFRGKEAQLDRQQQTSLQQMQQQFQMDFEKFRLPMNMMATFSDRMQTYVGQVMSDPNLTPEAKDQAIKNYYSYSQQTMGWMSSFFGTPMPNMTGGTSVQPGAAAAPAAPAAPAPAPAAAPAAAPAPSVFAQLPQALPGVRLGGSSGPTMRRPLDPAFGATGFR